MLKVQSPKLKGAIDSNGLIVVKLSFKVQCQSYVFFEPVQSNFVEIFLKSLKQFNHLYSGTKISVGDISEGLTDFGEEKNYVKEVMTNKTSQTTLTIPE